jgi:hypothetical protein
MAAQDGSQFQELLKLRRAGVDPNLIRAFGPEGARRALEAGQGARGAFDVGVKGVQQNPALAARLGTTSLLAGGNLLQGDLLGVATSTAGGLTGGALGTGLANLVPGSYKGIARAVFPIVGSLVGGIGAEQAGAKAAEYLGAGIPGSQEVSQRGQEERTRKFEREQQRLDYEAMSQAELARDKEYANYVLQAQIQQKKAMLPLEEQLMRTQLVNQQALNASNASLYQQMGRSATMGKAALQTIAETGATTRTLLSQNPYSGSVLQAPSISFG